MECGFLLERQALRVASLLSPACVVPGAGVRWRLAPAGAQCPRGPAGGALGAGAGAFPGSLGPLSLACSCRVPVGPLCVSVLAFSYKDVVCVRVQPGDLILPSVPLYRHHLQTQHSRVLRSRV